MGSSFPKPKLALFAPKDIKVSFKQEDSQCKKEPKTYHTRIIIPFWSFVKCYYIILHTTVCMEKPINAGCPGQTLCYYKCNGRVGTQM